MSKFANADTDLPVRPFETLAPKFDYWSSTHRQAAEALQFTCERPTLLTLFTGRGGSGKSTVARRVLRDNLEDSLIGVTSFSAINSTDPCRALLAAFGADLGPGENKGCRHDLTNHLRRVADEFGTPTLLVDDAHRLTSEKLQMLLDLAELDRDGAPLFKVALVGDTGLFDQLSTPQKGFLGPPFRLEPMTKEDTFGYVKHRLASAGIETMLFTDGALDVIHEITDGNAARVNLVCKSAIEEAETQWRDTIDEDIVRECYNPTRMALDLSKFAGVRLSPAPVLSSTGGVAEPPTKPVRAGVPEMKETDKASALSAIKAVPEPKLSTTQPLESDASSPRPSTAPSEKPADAAQALPDTPRLPRAAILGRNLSERSLIPRTAHNDNNGQAPAVANAKVVPRKSRLRGVRIAAIGTGLAAALTGVVWVALDPQEPADQPVEASLSDTEETQPFSAMAEQDPGDVVTLSTLYSDLSRAPLEPSIVLQASVSAPSAPPIEAIPVAATVVVDKDGATRLAEIHSALGLLPEKPAERFRHAIGIAGLHPQAAAAAYALAAYEGHPRAAYYLAQMYEVGEGIAVDVVLARSWYERAAGSVRGASRRLDVLPQAGPVTPIAAPIPLYVGHTKSGEIELAWTSAEGGNPAAYAVDFADQRGSILHRESNLVLSAFRTTQPEGAVYWRLEASASDGGEVAVGGWLPLSPDASITPAVALADVGSQ